MQIFQRKSIKRNEFVLSESKQPEFASRFIRSKAMLLFLFSRRWKEQERSIMRKMGFPICVKCGSYLTGVDDVPAAECYPEYGAPIDGMVSVGKRKNSPKK